MTIHHKAARVLRAIELAEIAFKRMNADRSEKHIRQAVMAMRLCQTIKNKIQPPKPE